MSYVIEPATQERALVMISFDDLPRRLRDMVNVMELEDVWEKGQPFSPHEDYLLRRYTACNVIRDGVVKKQSHREIAERLRLVLG